MNNQLKILLVSLVVLVASISSGSAQQRQPQSEAPTILERLRPLVEGASQPTSVAAMPSPNDRGDLAAYWITPVLTQRSAGSDFTNFGFSIVNPNPATAIAVSTRCFRNDGAEILALRQSVDVGPLHSAYIVTPLQGDMVAFWCAISSTASFAAFGYVVDPNSNTYRPRDIFSLMAAAR